MISKYYFPLDSKSLSHYFGCASLIPGKYLTNKPIDIQNKIEDALLLTTHLGTTDTDCCLEIVLIEEEENNLIQLKEGVFLYNKPLPITRVKTIFFVSKEQMEHTITNINISTAFIPKDIIQVVDHFEEVEASDIEVPSSYKQNDWSGQIKRYDKLLGGFCLMKVSGEDYMNYSDHYFSTLSFFNEVIKNELVNQGIDINSIYHDIFVGKTVFKVLLPLLNKVLTENDVYEVATLEKQTVIKDKITRVIDLNSLEKMTYIIAVLHTFGVGEESKRKKIDGLILSKFKSDIKFGKSEIVALCYGLNRGYTVFNNHYKINGTDRIVKFKLDSQLDYYTIESLYQYSFNDCISDAFPYLDKWCPKLSDILGRKKKTDYYVLDVKVTGKKKPKVTSQEYLSFLLKRFFQKEIEEQVRGFIDKIKITIYTDTVDELEDELIDKDEELKDERSKLNKLENECDKLRMEIQVLNSGRNSSYYPEPDKIKEDNNLDIPFSQKLVIAQEIFDYMNLKIKDLDKLASERGIKTKGLKKEEIIKELLKNNYNTLFQ